MNTPVDVVITAETPINAGPFLLSSSETPNEASRLAKLADAHASDPATLELLEGYAELAAEIAQCPMAWLSFARGRDELVSSSFGVTPTTVELQGSLIEAVIGAGEPVAVNFPKENLPIEERVAVAYCAGFPLVTAERQVIGAVFVAHNRPQTLSLAQQKSLTTLSRSILRTLALRGRLLEARAQLEASAQAVDKLQDMTIAKEVREAELSERNAELQTMAETDGLTGLRNHRSLFDEMVQKFESNAPFAFLLIDIDWFKNFNDAYGHVAGDQSLRTVGEILGSGANEETLVARYGGEEFGILLPVADAKAALAYGEELRRRIERHSWPHRPITVCVGVAIRTPEIGSVEDLVRRADAALYAAKRTGKNRVLAWSQNS